MVLLPLLLLPAFAVSVRLNACGSDVTDYDNYLDVSADIPIELVADMALGGSNSNDIYSDPSQGYFNVHHNYGYIGNWTKTSDDVRSREIYSHAKSEVTIIIHQEQTVNDAKKLVEVVATMNMVNPGIIGQPAILDDLEIITRTCVSPGTRYETDIHLTLSGDGRENVKSKMTVIYNRLGETLKKMEIYRQSYQRNFEFIETSTIAK